MTGPVSLVLEQEIRGEVRRQGTVVWLDKDASYTRFVADLAARQTRGEVPFPVVGFRGSFLALLFELEPYGSGLDRMPLLIHMPGYNEESIRKTPLLELYEAGVRFRKSLDTLIREAATARVNSDEIDRFLAKQPSLEEADAWLETSVSQSTFGLAAALTEIGPALLANALGRTGDALALRVTAPAEAEILASYLHKLTGMDEAWTERFAGTHRGALDPLLRALEAWILCVEYVHDLKREAHRPDLRRLRNLSPPLVKACRDLVAAVRRDSGDAYERMADEVAETFADELDAMTPNDLGQIDTFREEEHRVLTGAVEALHERDWPKAQIWWEARLGERSFWLQRDQLRRWAWMLVAEAARLGATLTRYAEPLEGARSLEQAVERYAVGAWEVDRAHRVFEQARLALLESRLPHYGALREVATELRSTHRSWADRLTRGFATLCQEHGFLPPAELQQRNLFEQVVHPLTQGGDKVAFFVIDALRYEMATELADELAGSGTVVDLRPRLAELPTITAVGMNALAPVAAAGRLAVAGIFQGFKTGEFTVRRREDRARAMGLRSTGKPALLLKLAEVCDKSTADLTRSIKPHQLVVVHSREIDDAGEANVGLPTFETTLRQIKAAWHHLQLAGIKNAVFTADHGFLLQDETTQVKPFGKKTDPQRRHVLDEYPRAEAGMVHVSLASLGYDGLTGYLLFRDDTAVFATGNPGATFVHGGLSPQERVIPVLTITRKHREQALHAEYVVEAEPLPDAVGLHRLKLRVVLAPGTLDFAVPRLIDVALRVPDREDVHVIVKDASGPATLRAGRLHMPVGDEWTEVFFGLEGPADERVRLVIDHAENTQNVTGATPETWYTVSGTTANPPRESTLPPPSAWESSIADEGIRKVFLHIEKHGAITEPEVTHLLGSPRAFRRFSLEFDDHLPKLPFGVRIEAGEGGKRYVRGDNR
jgi:hypothetical protein